jgi:hypothetical protein
MRNVLLQLKLAVCQQWHKTLAQLLVKFLCSKARVQMHMRKQTIQYVTFYAESCDLILTVEEEKANKDQQIPKKCVRRRYW